MMEVCSEVTILVHIPRQLYSTPCSLTLMSSKLQPTTAAQRPPPRQVTPSSAATTAPAPTQHKRSPQSVSPSTISSDSSSPSPTPDTCAMAGLKAPPTPDEASLAAARVQRRRKCNKEQQMFRLKYRLLRETARGMVYVSAVWGVWGVSV